ncbi:hypothetical protein L1N85_15065 [Paenibacillus alkaliterrae]|uniref:hypothetical protein n=1 Tax=Paenibacillus alkaliterrae TaxID=320909 RepID=UPI001F30D98A|nr:hypothetical protein [Paenibacillus alkaliterrae]MCF2939740.1 hypothetical protein [Paenibacillus alkaliterrae]
MKSNGYKVLWTSYARVALARMKEFKVDSMNVFRRTIVILSEEPKEKAYGVSDFPGFEFNGYYWTLIGNVVNTGMSHYIFWGIDPNEE